MHIHIPITQQHQRRVLMHPQPTLAAASPRAALFALAFCLRRRAFRLPPRPDLPCRCGCCCFCVCSAAGTGAADSGSGLGVTVVAGVASAVVPASAGAFEGFVRSSSCFLFLADTTWSPITRKHRARARRGMSALSTHLMAPCGTRTHATQAPTTRHQNNTRQGYRHMSRVERRPHNANARERPHKGIFGCDQVEVLEDHNLFHVEW